jgi:oligopeptide/dipeptide ABC transporter ATP-binding protein
MSAAENVLEVRGLSIGFSSFGERVNIVSDMNFEIGRGETLGVVGESGCGKSMTALAVMRLIKSPPGVITGRINFMGRDLLSLSEAEMRSVRGNKISMIFQEPMTSLNPVITIGHQLMEVFRNHHSISRAEARDRSVGMLKKVRIAMPEQRMDEYPHQLSGGMRQRVMIAMALSCGPELLIADEPTTALDVTIQAQILDLMKELGGGSDMSIMLITHDLGVVSEVCSRALIVYCGKIVESARAGELFERPLHPYTKGLLASLPRRGVPGRLHVIPGSVPSPKDFSAGCEFHPRCESATELCASSPPPFTERDGHGVRCWLYGEGGGAR